MHRFESFSHQNDRFEAEISGSSSTNNLFVPHQLRPIIGSNTYSQVQQKLQQHPPSKAQNNVVATMVSSVPPPPIPPAFIPTFMPQSNDQPPEKSYSSEPTPVVLSSAPKLYTNRPMSIQPSEVPVINQAPQVCSIQKISFNKIHRILFRNFFAD